MVALAGAHWAGLDTALAAAILNAFGIGLFCHLSLTLLDRQLTPRRHALLAICLATAILLSPIVVAGISGFSAPIYTATALLLFKALLDERYSALPWLGLLLSLIRPDGVVVGVAFSLIAFCILWRSPKRRTYIAHILLAGAVGIAYFIWRYSYFGYLLPLPLYVKSHGSDLFPGLSTNFSWLLANLPLICVAATALLHRTPERRRLALAVLPYALLLVVLCFANQTQNVSYRFQAPLTGIAILLAGFSASRWLGRTTDARAILTSLGGIAAVFAIYYSPLASNLRVLRAPEYINYLPYYLAPHTGTSTSIALTEAGRLAYWVDGEKVDLVGLNTAEPAVSGLAPRLLQDLQPDLIFVHTAGTLAMWPDQKQSFFSLSVDEVQRRRIHVSDLGSETDPVKRAPQIVYDFLKQNGSGYDIVMVEYYNRHEHLFAVRKAGTLSYEAFMNALGRSFAPESRLSYWEMKQLRRARRD